MIRSTTIAAAVLLFAVATPGSALAGSPPVRPVPSGPAPAPVVAADGPWELPVRRPVTDHFRAPLTPWGAGNRGWEFATVEGDPVVAVGSGVVTFAGRVAGRGAVTLDHGGGLLSSVTGMVELRVMRGQVVAAGALLGHATQRLHLGFRQDGRYVDPALLYARARHAVLVPVPEGLG